MHIFYLHGFASSAASTKAAFLAAKLREHGIELQTPDFNQPDFSTLTVTRMVNQVIEAIQALPPGPVVLIGSSLGAFVAVQGAAATEQHGITRGKEQYERRRLDRMILLAPALDFARRKLELGDRTIEDWKRTGTTNVFHYGYGRVMPIGYALYSDACGYDCLTADLTMPIQVFQGKHDTVVDPSMVEEWARRRANVELHMLDDDHQLGASLERMWGEMRRFLALRAP